MPSEILINVRPNQTRVAYVENKALSDFKIERKTEPTLVGSIYKGRVSRVLPGMQAAFVDIGLERAAFLYVDDVRSNASSFIVEDENASSERQSGVSEEGSAHLIQDLLQEGQTILVQVAKDSLGTKGARITTHISLPGRTLVYMPTLQHLGISRRIEEETERERLRQTIEKLHPQGGIIVRTAGEGASEESIKADLEYLNRLWEGLQRNYQQKSTPGLVHSEMDVELRALRDLLSPNVQRVLVDEQQAYQKVRDFVAEFMPRYKDTISLYEEAAPLFDLYDIDLEISRSLERKIWLKSGGFIVVDEVEALVVVDVNTGRFVGKKDLEDTILKTNLEAVKEIAHQLKIRNCGGIVIIDFIDMEKPAHRERVLNDLQAELQKDPATTTINSMSELGLVEMTRKRIRPSLVSTLCEPCPYCDGNGYIKRKLTIANEIFRTLEREGASTKSPLVVHCHSEVADWIYAEEGESLEFVEAKLGRSVAIEVEPEFHLEEFEVQMQQ